jgi:mono/diheme cytochrome c family protein
MGKKVVGYVTGALLLGAMLQLVYGGSVNGMTFQGARTTIWSGIYSADQASKGADVYRSCRGCHGATMDGSGSYPPLRGPQFIEHWREDNLESLYLLIKTQMPPRAELLSESDALNVLAYILEANEFPAGSDLNASTVGSIRFEGREGPRPLPDYALVQLVGCLTKVDEGWRMTNASEPVRVRKPGKPTPDELKAVEAKALGTYSFPLQNLAMSGINPEGRQGQKMYAKGALLKRQEGDRISITSMDMIAATCP